MTAALTLATSEHLEQVIGLCAAFHEEEQIKLSEDARRAGLEPLLEGSPYGVIYLIGPPRAPIGYIALCFSWSVEFGGLDAMIDEIYIRPGVRGRGIASEALIALPNALIEGGLRAIHLEVDHGNDAAIKLYRRSGFVPRDKYMLMTRKL